MSIQPVLVPTRLQPPSLKQSNSNLDTNGSAKPLPLASEYALSEADIDRFATLFSPATPPATPTGTSAPPPLPVAPVGTRPRKLSSDEDFGAFVSVPPTQDPLAVLLPDLVLDGAGKGPSQVQAHAKTSGNVSLVYFDQFTSSAKTASERNRKELLDELLHHEDDPMYFIHEMSALRSQSPSLPPSPPPPPAPPPPSSTSIPIPIPVLTSTDEALAEALASEMSNPKLVRVERGGSVRVAPSPSHARVPLPPRLSENPWPPSTSSAMPPSRSPTPSSSAPSMGASATVAHPAQATLSRISSSFVSLLPSSRPRSTAPTASPTPAPSQVPSSLPNTFSRFTTPATSTTLTHGSPFASTLYIPPTGAPGFAGDRAWDRGFSEALERDEKRGLVDPVGLGIGHGHGAGREMTTHMKHAKGKGVTLVGRWESTARVLDEDMADLLRSHLPALTKLPRRWTLLYSIDQHGISINTLYARCEPRVPTRTHPNPAQGGLLAIRDARDGYFGAWLSEGVKLEKGGYYGSGDSWRFLWRYYPPPAADGERQGERQEQGRLEVYPWTGANAYVALCEPGFISFGGGDGHYGLYVDASLLEGSSAPCPTFGNPALSGKERGVKPRGEVPFECVGLEVWGIGPG